MNTIAEIKTDLDRMYGIYSRGIQCFSDYIYLTNPKTDNEKTIAETDAFISNIKLLLADKSILEINKLFGGKSDKYSFNKLFKILLNNRVNSEWENKITPELIDILKNKITENNIKETIKRINKWRNEYIAHTDKNQTMQDVISIKPQELLSLCIVIEEILNEILAAMGINSKYLTRININSNANNVLVKISYYDNINQDNK